MLLWNLLRRFRVSEFSTQGTKSGGNSSHPSLAQGDLTGFGSPVRVSCVCMDVKKSGQTRSVKEWRRTVSGDHPRL